MPSNKLTILLNSHVYHNIITEIAQRMGTSRRNVMAIALVEILKHTYTREYLNELKTDITIDYQTSTTINELVSSKIENVERHGLSRRWYFGLLISDYFLKHGNDLLPSLSDLPDAEEEQDKGHIEFEVAAEDKERILSYCQSNSIGLSSFYIHYLLYEDVELVTYEIQKKEKINILLNSHAKKVLKNRSEESNCSFKFFLQMVTGQIIRHIDP